MKNYQWFSSFFLLRKFWNHIKIIDRNRIKLILKIFADPDSEFSASIHFITISSLFFRHSIFLLMTALIPTKVAARFASLFSFIILRWNSSTFRRSFSVEKDLVTESRMLPTRDQLELIILNYKIFSWCINYLHLL